MREGHFETDRLFSHFPFRGVTFNMIGCVSHGHALSTRAGKNKKPVKVLIPQRGRQKGGTLQVPETIPGPVSCLSPLTLTRSSLAETLAAAARGKAVN